MRKCTMMISSRLTDKTLKDKCMMQDKHYVKAIEQADSQARSDLERIEQQSRPSTIMPDLSHLALFITARSIHMTYDELGTLVSTLLMYTRSKIN